MPPTDPMPLDNPPGEDPNPVPGEPARKSGAASSSDSIATSAAYGHSGDPRAVPHVMAEAFSSEPIEATSAGPPAGFTAGAAVPRDVSPAEPAAEQFSSEPLSSSNVAMPEESGGDDVATDSATDDSATAVFEDARNSSDAQESIAENDAVDVDLPAHAESPLLPPRGGHPPRVDRTRAVSTHPVVAVLILFCGAIGCALAMRGQPHPPAGAWATMLGGHIPYAFALWLGKDVACFAMAASAGAVFMLLLGAGVLRQAFWVLGLTCGFILPTVVRVLADVASIEPSATWPGGPHGFAEQPWPPLGGLLVGVYAAYATRGMKRPARIGLIVFAVLGAAAGVGMLALAGGGWDALGRAWKNPRPAGVVVAGMAILFGCAGAVLFSEKWKRAGKVGRNTLMFPIMSCIITLTMIGGYAFWTRATIRGLFAQARTDAAEEKWDQVQSTVHRMEVFASTYPLPNPVIKELQSEAQAWNDEYPRVRLGVVPR